MIKIAIYASVSLISVYLAVSVMKARKSVKAWEIEGGATPPYPQQFMPLVKYLAPVVAFFFGFISLVNAGQCFLLILKG